MRTIDNRETVIRLHQLEIKLVTDKHDVEFKALKERHELELKMIREKHAEELKDFPVKDDYIMIKEKNVEESKSEEPPAPPKESLPPSYDTNADVGYQTYDNAYSSELYNEMDRQRRENQKPSEPQIRASLV